MRHKIAITGLRVFAHHGVFDFERQNGQDFYIDAAIWIDGDKDAFTDNLNNTAHYGDLAKGLVELTKNDPVDLLETLAQRLLDYALNFGGGKVLKAKITVHKPGAPIPYEFEDVSITVKAKKSS
jgi:dihydroneopterin aldolase